MFNPHTTTYARLVATRLRPVLVANGDAHLVTLVLRLLEPLRETYALMVISQPAELRQYLQDTLRLSRLPAAIVLNTREAVGLALLAWIRDQRNDIAAIPIVALGTEPQPLHSHVVVLGSPTAERLIDALRHVLLKEMER